MPLRMAWERCCHTECQVEKRSRLASKMSYSHLDKEALAIVYGVKTFHQYLHSRRFEIKTGHKPLTSGRVQRLALTLSGYDYSIQYKEERDMANADALNRLPLTPPQAEIPRPPELVHLVEHLDSTHLSCTQIRTWSDHDPTLSRVRKWVQGGWPTEDQIDDPNL